MTNSQRLAKVRACLLRWIADQERADAADSQSTENGSGSPRGLSILRESILIRGEFFCGRRFYTANHNAVWFIEEDELKIYRNDGELCCTIDGSKIDDDLKTEPVSGVPSILKLPNPGPDWTDSQDSTRRAA